MKKNILLFVLIYLSAASSLHVSAQQNNAATEAIRKVLKEKIRDENFQISYPIDKSVKNNINSNPHVNQTNVQVSDYVVSPLLEPESEIQAAINPLDTNNLVCSSNAFPASTANDIPVNRIYYSTNFGTSWSLSLFDPLPDTSGVSIIGGGDPAFAFDKNGRVYYSWINLYSPNFGDIFWDLLWAYSDDGGATWNRGSIPTIQKCTGPFGALFDPSLFIGPASDKEWLAVDVSSSIYQNTLYCAYIEMDGQANTQNIVVRRKLPANNFFTQTSSVVSGAGFLFIQFAGIDVDNLGQIHVSFFGSPDSVNYYLYHSVSSDGGVIFSHPNIVSEVQSYNFTPTLVNQTIPGIAVDRIYPCPAIVADKSTGTTTSGNLYMTWTGAGITSPLNHGSDIYFSRSVDHGNTWSNAIPLNSNASGDSTHQYYSSINVSNGGTIVVCWYDRRNFSDQNTQYFMAYSDDGGQTFGNDFQITSLETDFATVGMQNQDFGIGEYNAVLTTPGTVIPFWTDGRTNDGDLNIYSAIVRLDSLSASVISINGVNNDFSLSNPYPNPAGNLVSFTASSMTTENVDIFLTDISGKLISEIFQGTLSGKKKYEINLSSYESGNYFIVMKSKNGITQKRLSIQRHG